MRTPVFLLLVMQLLPSGNQQLAAQQKPAHIIRAYWDNDFFNIRGKGTDEAYTNGFRFDLFHQQRRGPKNFLGKLLPIAGDSSTNIRGWGFGQMMITPNDLTRTDDQPADYSYAGALVAVHSLYSYNAKKKYSFQTEVMMGARGPLSFSAQTQVFIHRLIGDQRPMGWDNQLPGQFIINIKFTGEKELFHLGRMTEVIIGAQALAGTLINQLTTFTTVRIGKMTPYFNGYISQHHSKRSLSSGKRSRFQAYLILRPSAGITVDNDMLKKHSNASQDPSGATSTLPSIEPWNFNLEYGMEINAGRIGLSFIQKSISPMLKGLPRHEVGNVSMHYSR